MRIVPIIKLKDTQGNEYFTRVEKSESSCGVRGKGARLAQGLCSVETEATTRGHSRSDQTRRWGRVQRLSKKKPVSYTIVSSRSVTSAIHKDSLWASLFRSEAKMYSHEGQRCNKDAFNYKRLLIRVNLESSVAS